MNAADFSARVFKVDNTRSLTELLFERLAVKLLRVTKLAPQLWVVLDIKCQNS